jgi:hypothetical protein
MRNSTIINPGNEEHHAPTKERNWSLQKDIISLSVEPRAPITYDIEVQCELTSKSLDVKTTV